MTDDAHIQPGYTHTPGLYDLDDAHIVDAATYTAAQLVIAGYANVRLTPGDMTEYRLAVVARYGPVWTAAGLVTMRDHLVVVANGFGAAYEWRGEQVSSGYAAEKWTSAGAPASVRDWTGEVVARFLSALADALKALGQ